MYFACVSRKTSLLRAGIATSASASARSLSRRHQPSCFPIACRCAYIRERRLILNILRTLFFNINGLIPKSVRCKIKRRCRKRPVRFTRRDIMHCFIDIAGLPFMRKKKRNRKRGKKQKESLRFFLFFYFILSLRHFQKHRKIFETCDYNETVKNSNFWLLLLQGY